MVQEVFKECSESVLETFTKCLGSSQKGIWQRFQNSTSTVSTGADTLRTCYIPQCTAAVWFRMCNSIMLRTCYIPQCTAAVWFRMYNCIMLRTCYIPQRTVTVWFRLCNSIMLRTCYIPQCTAAVWFRLCNSKHLTYHHNQDVKSHRAHFSWRAILSNAPVCGTEAAWAWSPQLCAWLMQQTWRGQ